jgi:flagellar M-ring protein FliF
MARIVVAVIAVATVGAIFYIVSTAGGAAYAPAFTNLDAKTAARVESALAGGHIPAKLTDGGATVAVPSSMVDQARVLVGNAGITTSGHAGNDLLTTSGLFSGTSEQWDARVTQARSGVLATQIEAISGVQHAEVNLAIPPTSIFQQDQGKTTASIQVTLGGGTLTDSAVRGIVSLVANAVPGLAPQNVTVIDEHGNQLSSANSAIGLQTADRFAAENAFFSSKTAIAQAALDRVLGPGNSSVVVAGHLNFDQSTSSSRTFGAPHGTINGSTESETLQSGGGSGGASGTTANIPGAVAGSTGSTSNYKHDVKSGTSALDTTETTTTKASGSPTDMQIALVVSKKAEQTAGVNATTLQSIVQNAVGYEGTVTPALNKTSVAEVNALPNAAQALKSIGVGVVQPGAGAAAAGGGISSLVPAPFNSLLAPLGALLLALAFLFMVRKALKKRQALLGTTDSSWLPALEAPPIRVDDLVAQVSAGPTRDEIAAAERKALAGRVEELAQNRPGDVAAQLRGWLASDE